MNTTTTTTAYKVMGVNNDHDTCSCCGRTGLKRVVWLARVDVDGFVGTPEPVGTSCAAMLLRCTTTKVERLAVDADLERERQERNRVHEIGEARSVCNWIVESIGAQGQTSPLTQANGLKNVVERWAAAKYPNLIVTVRKAR